MLCQWYRYAAAMRRRRSGSELSFYRWEAYSQREDVVKYETEDGLILGHLLGEIFIPSHFSPRGIRGGYRLMKSLLRDYKVVFMVPDDLAQQLIKLGCWDTGITLRTWFRGEEVTKHLIFSSEDILSELGNMCGGQDDLPCEFQLAWGRLKSSPWHPDWSYPYEEYDQ